MKHQAHRILIAPRLAAILGACALLAACAGSVGSGAAGTSPIGGAIPDAGGTIPSYGDVASGSTASSGTKLYVVAEGDRVLVNAPGGSQPVIWAKLAQGDVLGFAYLDKAYRYQHGSATTELLPEAAAGDMVASAIVGTGAEIGMPSLALSGAAQPHLLIVRGVQASGGYAYVLSSCSSVNCSGGPADSTQREAAANQAVSVGGGHTLEFRAGPTQNGVAKTLFALRRATSSPSSTSTPSTGTTGTTAAPAAPTAPAAPPAPPAPTAPAAPQRKQQDDDSWSLGDWLLVGGAVVGGVLVFKYRNEIGDFFSGSGSTTTTTPAATTTTQPAASTTVTCHCAYEWSTSQSNWVCPSSCPSYANSPDPTWYI